MNEVKVDEENYVMCPAIHHVEKVSFCTTGHVALCKYFKRIIYNGTDIVVECNYEKPITLLERIEKILLEQFKNCGIEKMYCDLRCEKAVWNINHFKDVAKKVVEELEKENAKVKKTFEPPEPGHLRYLSSTKKEMSKT